MRKQGRGRIICMASVGGIVPIPYQSFYAASKSAIITLARSLDLEVKDLGVRVTAFCPGDIKTPFTAARETNIFILVFSFGGTNNINLRNFARSYFCVLIILLIIVGFFALFTGAILSSKALQTIIY